MVDHAGREERDWPSGLYGHTPMLSTDRNTTGHHIESVGVPADKAPGHIPGVLLTIDSRRWGVPGPSRSLRYVWRAEDAEALGWELIEAAGRSRADFEAGNRG